MFGGTIASQRHTPLAILFRELKMWLVKMTSRSIDQCPDEIRKRRRYMEALQKGVRHAAPHCSTAPLSSDI